jgi:hypothetical protein
LVAAVLYYALYYSMGVIAYLAGWIDAEARGWNREATSLTASLVATVIYYLWLRQLLARAAAVRTV